MIIVTVTIIVTLKGELQQEGKGNSKHKSIDPVSGNTDIKKRLM